MKTPTQLALRAKAAGVFAAEHPEIKYREIAEMFGVSITLVGLNNPNRVSHPWSVTHRARRLFAEHPDATVREIAEALGVVNNAVYQASGVGRRRSTLSLSELESLDDQRLLKLLDEPSSSASYVRRIRRVLQQRRRQHVRTLRLLGMDYAEIAEALNTTWEEALIWSRRS